MNPNHYPTPHRPSTLPMQTSVPLPTSSALDPTAQGPIDPAITTSNMVNQILQTFGVQPDKDLEDTLRRIKMQCHGLNIDAALADPLNSDTPFGAAAFMNPVDDFNPVDAILERAKQTYRREVDKRKQEQLRRHYQDTGEDADSLTPDFSRKLTNRATAGAGKKRNQELLCNLEQFARSEVEHNKRTVRFLMGVLMKNSETVKRARQVLAAHGGGAFEGVNTQSTAWMQGIASGPQTTHWRMQSQNQGGGGAHQRVSNTSSDIGEIFGASTGGGSSFLEGAPGDCHRRNGDTLPGNNDNDRGTNHRHNHGSRMMEQEDDPMDYSEVSECLSFEDNEALLPMSEPQQKENQLLFFGNGPALRLPNPSLDEPISYAPHAA